MPDISAISLQTALTPTPAAPLENAGNPAETGTSTPPASFDTMLAQNVMVQALVQATVQAATPETATAILPEGGKTLPDAANAAAARPQLIQLRITPTGKGEAKVPTDPQLALTEEDDALSLPEPEVVPQPDIALFAAIFTAPERLAAAAPDRPAIAPRTPAQTQAATAAAVATVATPATVATAIASTAQIELTPATQKFAATRVTTATAKAATTDAAATDALAVQTARPVTAAQGTDLAASDTPSDTPGESALRKLAVAAPEAAKPQFTDAAVPSVIITDAPLQADTQPVTSPVRAEVKPERIDFATLVDTLARAREDASPRSINVAVTNTDFGRVSLRFDSRDDGLSVAMSSADPGFARAVSASNDASATSADTRGQNQQTQSDTRAQAGDANSSRQQQGHQSQPQQSGRTDPRLAASSQTSTRREDDATARSASAGDSGIYA